MTPIISRHNHYEVKNEQRNHTIEYGYKNERDKTEGVQTLYYQRSGRKPPKTHQKKRPEIGGRIWERFGRIKFQFGKIFGQKMILTF